MTDFRVYVLRLGHRPLRDARVTTHVLLTARAFGASGAIYSGERDAKLEETIRDVVERWGGDFEVRYEKDWRSVLSGWKNRGSICHLTMYGIPVDECLDEIPRVGDILVVVGSKKVPRDVYELADFNVAIGNQPHSEVAALAVFLDRLFGGEELKREFNGAKIRIIPQRRGKKVEEVSKS